MGFQQKLGSSNWWQLKILTKGSTSYQLELCPGVSPCPRRHHFSFNGTEDIRAWRARSVTSSRRVPLKLEGVRVCGWHLRHVRLYRKDPFIVLADQARRAVDTRGGMSRRASSKCAGISRRRHAPRERQKGKYEAVAQRRHRCRHICLQ